MNILLVDDHALFLEGIKNFLEANDIKVVGTAQSSEDALNKIELLQPELILMDVQLAEDDGVAATRLIKHKYPEVKVVMLTACEDEEQLFAAIQAGAVGYLIKSMEPKQFLQQLTSLQTGELPLAPGFAKRLLGEFTRRRQQDKPLSAATEAQLTERQTEILQLLTEGLTYREIGQRLELKVVTIKYHIKEIITKLHLSNRAQLIAHASRLKLTEEK